jgi:hypothetical protein
MQNLRATFRACCLLLALLVSLGLAGCGKSGNTSGAGVFDGATPEL